MNIITITNETFFVLILGHLIGDYILQPSWIAFNKKDRSLKGFVACALHCSIYTSVIYILLIISNSVKLNDIINATTLFILLFYSHWIIDRYYLVKRILNITQARSWDTHVDLTKPALSTQESMYLSFGAIVYVTCDNTIHLLLMYIILKCC